MSIISRYTVAFFFAILFICSSVKATDLYPKREFRGAWIQAINGQLQGKSSNDAKAYLIDMLDKLQKANVNAILFQVRPEADALYNSSYEPWSRFLTGKQGVAPSPYWDPMEFMIAECHKRNMEFHAWINPYRAKIKTTQICDNHPYRLHPERFIVYDNQYYFNPALQVNRDYICQIVSDIVMRYDVDGIHMDDYFYPYKVKGLEFADGNFFASDSRGFTDRDEWRRDNVNQLIEQLHKTIRKTKPWVKFGVSPFGIYRNQSSDAKGSRTNGTQGYDDLYADVLLWVNKGWVDYCIPQLYWEIGHKAADYETLVGWWAKYADNRPLFIGQDVNRTVKAPDLQNPNINQQPRKMELQRSYSAVGGSCLWDAGSAANNVGNYREVLSASYHRYPALLPEFRFIDKKAPSKIKGAKAIDTDDGLMLVWLNKEARREMDKAVRFVVYRFNKGEKIDISNPAKIVEITNYPFYKLPYVNGETSYTYVITALDRLQNESKGVKCKVKL